MKRRIQRPIVTLAIAWLVISNLGLGQVAAPPATNQQGVADTAKTSDAAKRIAKLEAEAESIYLRILRNDRDTPIAMQTSVVSFTKRETGKPDVIVDLIGAVHVADKSYFRQLSKRFTQYDALLYELVAPDDNNVPTGGQSKHPVGQMQQGMKNMLELAYQLEEIDYSKRNFVHADMSPDEFSRVMSERGESFFQMMLRATGSALATQSSKKGGDAQLLFALFSSNRAVKLKRVMSTQFSDLESSMQAIEGPNGSTIIGQRNKKCLAVLDRELKKGKKRIGVFYGAGHMPDMEARLAERFGLYPNQKSIKWLTAWDMSGKKK